MGKLIGLILLISGFIIAGSSNIFIGVVIAIVGLVLTWKSEKK